MHMQERRQADLQLQGTSMQNAENTKEEGIQC